MYKIKYYFRLLRTMNYKKFFNTVNIVSKRSNKSKIGIIIDMFLTSIICGSGYVDYNLLEFENLTMKERKTFITRQINNDYVKKYNDKDYFKYFDNKYLFDQKFNKYLNRDYICLNNSSFDDFKNFIKKYPTIVVKPLDDCCGKGVQFINSEGYNPKSLYDRLIKNKQVLIEEPIKQCEKLNELNYSSVNTIRIVTFLKNDKVNILFSAVRIGKNNEKVDNFNHGGILCLLDENGVIKTNAVSKDGEVFKEHPQTHTKFIGFKIPEYKKTLKLINEVALVEKHIRYVAWDVAISEKGPLIIEANHIPGYDLYQNKEHLENKHVGLKNKFDKIMEG